MHLYLKGFTPTELATRLGHPLDSVERYLDDFCLVMMGLEEGYSPARIARNARLSERLVEEYAFLYHRYSSHPEYASIMARLRERLAYLLKKASSKGARPIRRASDHDRQNKAPPSQVYLRCFPAEVAV